jgi:arsenate reductase-like glutaredoxin family protein
MAERHLHIITHDVPWPADFGGVMDLFYKIKTLHQNGVKIYLHCFVNERPKQDELNKYCAKVYYYQREKSWTRFSFRVPFIVSTRKSAELLTNLQQDNYPVLIEGVHCSWHLFTGHLSNRIVLLRLHNAEFEYYHQLALHESSPLKKMYYQHESALLKKYENKLAGKVNINAVSAQDVALYQQYFKAPHIDHLPVFLPYETAAGREGNGCFCLYHANLAINENEAAAIWLLQEVFQDLEIPFVIAGKNPSQKLEFMAHQHAHTCLVSNPSDKELHDMIAKAQINILPSFNNTGVKLKLLNALYNGRHCLVNEAGVTGSGLDNLCTIAETAAEFKTIIKNLYTKPYALEENDKRQQVLQQLYNNQKNADRLIEIFWSQP